MRSHREGHAKPPARLAESDRCFVEAVGERIALLGARDGSLECWMWPLILFEGLEIGLRGAGGEALRTGARRVRVVPEGLELALPLSLPTAPKRPSGELRLAAFAAHEERALVLVVSLTGELAGTVELSFRPAMRPMWPAGMGAQTSGPDAETGALLLTEELGRFAALIGAPDAEPLALAADRGVRERVTLRLPITRERAERGPCAVIVCGAELQPEPLSEAARRGAEGAACGTARAEDVVAEARALYHRLAEAWPALIEGERARWSAFLEQGAELATNDETLDRAFLWSRIAIERAWARVDGIGRALLAGLGPSHGGDRPGFAWFFNGDALAASRALGLLGEGDACRAILRFAASTQRADGKLTHEISLSASKAARLCDWYADYPYAYYKGQVTPGFVACLAHYVKLSGDVDLARELLPAARAAVDWCVTTLDDAGRMRVDRAGIAAVEAGPLAGRIRTECYLQGIWISALEGAAYLARVTEDSALKGDEEGSRLAGLLAEARAGLASFWREDRGHLGFAHLADGERCDDLAVYSALAVARGQLDPERTLRAAAALNAPELVADWGARMFAEDAAVYDPAHYNTGSVFPYLTNFLVLALYRAGLPDAGFAVLRSQALLDGFLGPGYLPEFLLGDRAECPPRAVPHQVFSQATVLQGVIFGLLGLEADDAGALVLAPALPVGVDRLRIDRLAFRGRRFDVALERRRTGGTTELECTLALRSGAPLRVALRPLLPPLSEVSAVERDGAPWPGEPRVLASGAVALHAEPFELAPGSRARLRVTARAGPALDLTLERIVRGAASSGARLVGQVVDEGALEWTLAGRAGARYTLRFASDLALDVEGARLEGEHLHVAFPDVGSWPRTVVRLRPVTP